MILEFQRTKRMGHALDCIGLTMGKIVGGIDAPCIPRAWMGGTDDPIQHRIAHVDVPGCHIDLGTEHPGAVFEFPGPHAPEKIKVFVNTAVPMGTVFTGFGQRAAIFPHFFRGEIVNKCLVRLDQVFRPGIKLFKVIGRVFDIAIPVEAQPGNVFADGIDEFLIFLRRICIVEAQITLASKFGRNSEVQANRFCVTDMQITVGFRRKPSNHLFTAPVIQITSNLIADEVANLGEIGVCVVFFCHVGRAYSTSGTRAVSL